MKDKPFAITLDVGSSLANKTGSWRTQRPVYLDLLPPCNSACPAGENVQSWLYHAEEGDYEAAWRQLMDDNPFPAVMGRVCYRPCETACNRGDLDQPVGINAVERFIGDEAIRRGWTLERDTSPSGKRVLVVGAGPAGLSAAYHLTRLGHAVTVRDSGGALGGMMRYGIPTYRLPRDVLDAETQRIQDLGVHVELAHRVDAVDVAMREGGFDAVFVAVGAHLAQRTYIPAGDSAHIIDAVTLLRDMEGHTQPMLGRRVAIYGGGNTAIDAARTARRLGATDAVVVYRRTRDQMPAHDSEVDEALAEGVTMKWLSTVSHVDAGSITLEKMRLDDSGSVQPTGEFETLGAESVILALGQHCDLALVQDVPGINYHDGVVQVGPTLMTGHPGIFAGGDMIDTQRTVTHSIGHGKKAARYIDAWLQAAPYHPAVKHDPATPDRLNTWYYADAPATVRPELDAARRISTFDEVVGGLNETTALYEARRCLSCGNCFECDNCYGVCPDNAVIKLGPGKRYEIDYDYCKGCGICATECPCGAITMQPEIS